MDDNKRQNFVIKNNKKQNKHSLFHRSEIYKKHDNNIIIQLLLCRMKINYPSYIDLKFAFFLIQDTLHSNILKLYTY